MSGEVISVHVNVCFSMPVCVCNVFCVFEEWKALCYLDVYGAFVLGVICTSVDKPSGATVQFDPLSPTKEN